MKDPNEPENRLIAHFPSFVPEKALCQKPREPASEDFEEMESSFRNSPLVVLGLALVGPVEVESEAGDDHESSC